jgi:bifunctional non-homologous end joining protein LigD
MQPMLASPMPKNFSIKPGEWVAEEKYDGHRILLSVDRVGLNPDFKVEAISRDGNRRELPGHIMRAIGEHVVAGFYDCELLIPGKRSYGVTVVADAPKLVLVFFDVLEVSGKPAIGFSYSARRELLTVLFGSMKHGVPWLGPGEFPLRLASSRALGSLDEAREHAEAVWRAGGEGLILKRASSLYQPGKRSKDWIKIKDLRSAVLTVIGFQVGLLGPRAVVRLRDEDGNETTVKAKNDAERGKLSAADVGRKLRIEFQERTPGGGYRHPRWDRWENE